jgi:hypothetical protein
MVIGVLMFWQRERVSQMNREWNKRLGKPGELSSAIGTPKYFGIGAILMTLGGAAIVIYSMVLPSHGESSDVLWVFIVTGILAVILAGVALVMYRRYKK